MEYLLVGVVLISMIVALGALWHFVAGGSLAGILEGHASHALVEIGGIADALAF